MSLYGYIKKTKAANWTLVVGAKQVPTPVKVEREKKSYKRIASMSEKRKGESREYIKLRAEFLTAHPKCQGPFCNAPATCVHHWAGRRSNYLKVETWRASCLDCNDWAKQATSSARALGWIAPIGVYLT